MFWGVVGLLTINRLKIVVLLRLDLMFGFLCFASSLRILVDKLSAGIYVNKGGYIVGVGIVVVEIIIDTWVRMI